MTDQEKYLINLIAEATAVAENNQHLLIELLVLLVKKGVLTRDELSQLQATLLEDVMKGTKDGSS